MHPLSYVCDNKALSLSEKETWMNSPWDRQTKTLRLNPLVTHGTKPKCPAVAVVDLPPPWRQENAQYHSGQILAVAYASLPRFAALLA
jgi:hypothetical protein